MTYSLSDAKPQEARPPGRSSVEGPGSKENLRKPSLRKWVPAQWRSRSILTRTFSLWTWSAWRLDELTPHRSKMARCFPSFASSARLSSTEKLHIAEKPQKPWNALKAPDT
eukprot:s8791_g3.t1